MKRSLMFPLVMGICGALFVPAYLGESVVAQWPAYTFPFSITAREVFILYLLPIALYGLTAGILIGIGMAFWNLICNRVEQNVAKRLCSNLFWFGCYALAFAIANRIIAELVLIFSNSVSSGNFKLEIMLFWWLGTLLFNFTAILWAAIRSITTDDILTPRVLRGKLRERARLN